MFPKINVSYSHVKILFVKNLKFHPDISSLSMNSFRMQLIQFLNQSLKYDQKQYLHHLNIEFITKYLSIIYTAGMSTSRRNSAKNTTSPR